MISIIKVHIDCESQKFISLSHESIRTFYTLKFAWLRCVFSILLGTEIKLFTMKKLLLLSAFCLMQIALFAQTAVDFTANDCDGTSHNLFSELNSGKVIVLCWVMPCGACTGPSLTTLNVVNSYAVTNPNTVYMYIVDDYANTSCASLDNWRDHEGLSGAKTFSNASINMADYGSTGMPKIVVIGGGSHTVFYNANNTVNPNDLQTAINSALQLIGINEQNTLAKSVSVSPNPAHGKTELKFTLTENAQVEVKLFNMQGAMMKNVYSGKLSQGANTIGISTSGIAAGTYLLKISSGSKSNYLNLVIGS